MDIDFAPFLGGKRTRKGSGCRGFKLLVDGDERLQAWPSTKSYYGQYDCLPATEYSNTLMHPFSVLTLGIFSAGYITARWDLVTRLYELAVFAADHGVVVCFEDFHTLSTIFRIMCLTSTQTRAAKGFAILSVFFFVFILPIERLAARETSIHPRSAVDGISAREQLRRRGSF